MFVIPSELWTHLLEVTVDEDVERVADAVTRFLHVLFCHKMMIQHL